MNTIFAELFQSYPQLSVCKDSILEAFDILVASVASGGKILVCGSGGSAADSEHIVGELMKGFLLKRPISGEAEVLSHLQDGIPAISLASQAALLTAFSNDCSFDFAFAQQVYVYSKNSPNDCLIALSTSGNSASTHNAAKAAEATGIKSIGITGERTSKLSEVCNICIQLPANETFKIQELTLPVYHALCAALEEKFFGQAE